MGKSSNRIVSIIISGAIGLFIGTIFGRPLMAILFCILAVMANFIYDLRSRTQYLNHEIEKLKRHLQPKKSSSPIKPVESVSVRPISKDAPPPIPPQTISQPAMATQTTNASIPHAISSEVSNSKNKPYEPTPKTQEPQKTSTDFNQKVIQHVTDFFTKGNLVVKVGVIIFFFGIGFLLKYAAEHSLLPIELRLCFSGVCGIVLLGIGFRLRKIQEIYSTTLQGAGIGVLYLTVFGTAKLYALMPIGFAFFIMIGIVIFSGILAIIQDAKSLAVFGIIGGFLSPILMSTGSGSHVALFSYYALLNLGIFGTAWFKSWRILNWIGFIFTFVIGFLWGYKYYQPQYFSTTEPFLILHFLFYATISVLFAFRQPVKLKGYIDGTLVFGLPVIVFALQSALVKNMEFAMAFSALGAGGFYVILCFVLWKKKMDGMKLLCESFLSLGVVFLSLAIPFAFDSGWTSGIWALEGAGILWIGLRQDRNAPKYFGILLQVAAALSFVHTVNSPVKDVPIANAIFLSCLAISIAALLTNYFLTTYGWSKKTASKHNLFIIPLLWGLIWWFANGINEIFIFIPHNYQFAATLAFLSISCMAFSSLRLKLNWKDIEYPLFLLPYTTLIMTIFSGVSEILSHPCEDFAWIAFILVLMVQYHILFWHEKTWKNRVTGYMHRANLYLVIILITWQAYWAIDLVAQKDTVWSILSWGIIPALYVLFLIQWGKKIKWPIAAFEEDYCLIGILPVIAFIGLWIIAMCFDRADPAPLPYIPIANPGDLAYIFGFIVIIKWILHLKTKSQIEHLSTIRDIISYIVTALIFLWMNTLIARGIHYFAQVPFNLEDLMDSVIFQAGISILWTTLALATMVFAHKKAWRNIWFAGASLLGAAVLKLFLIDLVEIDTIARIISFLVVGILMLIIGYFSPLPPQKKEAIL